MSAPAHTDFQQRVFPYRRHADQDAATPAFHPVVVVGAGPVGLALAIDLAQQQVPVLLLDNDDRLSTGSRAICFAKRTLEIFDRLGCGQPMVETGVSWRVGRVFLGDGELYRFDLLPEPGHERPAFINLQQYYVEGYLAEHAARQPGLQIRWKQAVTGLQPNADGVTLTVDTPDGPCTLRAGRVVACDGARSTLRRLMGLESKGQTFRDRFLIADVKMAADFPAERWFWFDPPFHPGQSVLLHKQPDDVWRIDFQLGWDADPEAEKAPERILPRVRALLAHTAMKDAPFTLEWASVYTFACLRMDAFVHAGGRVIFAGDAAHGVSPFGARGANSGVQDAENLAWKLAAVHHGRAGAALIASYGPEREYAADENILNSTRSTDFITPKSTASRRLRDAVLQLARTEPFARRLLNSGRLSVPAVLRDSTLNTPDNPADGPWDSALQPGAAMADAPLHDAQGRTTWLLRQLHTGPFHALVFDDASTEGQARADAAEAALAEAAPGLAPLRVLRIGLGSGQGTANPAGRTALHDTQGLLLQRTDARPGTVWLLRPDQHLAARWRKPCAQDLRQALRRALALC